MAASRSIAMEGCTQAQCCDMIWVKACLSGRGQSCRQLWGGTESMPVLNSDIARNLDKLADLIELGRGNPFRIRAHRNAAGMSQSAAAPESVGLSMGMASAMTCLPVFLVRVLGAGELVISAIEGVAKAMTLQCQGTWNACLGGAQTPGDPFLWSRT
jgi:hypothetical protein